MSMKNPLTPAGIEPATYRFVAQHLNHCATAVPTQREENSIFTTILEAEAKRSNEIWIRADCTQLASSDNQTMLGSGKRSGPFAGLFRLQLH